METLQLLGRWKIMTKPWEEDSGILNSRLCLQTHKSPHREGRALWCVASGAVADGTALPRPPSVVSSGLTCLGRVLRAGLSPVRGGGWDPGAIRVAMETEGSTWAEGAACPLAPLSFHCPGTGCERGCVDGTWKHGAHSEEMPCTDHGKFSLLSSLGGNCSDVYLGHKTYTLESQFCIYEKLRN